MEYGDGMSIVYMQAEMSNDLAVLRFLDTQWLGYGSEPVGVGCGTAASRVADKLLHFRTVDQTHTTGLTFGKPERMFLFRNLGYARRLWKKAIRAVRVCYHLVAARAEEREIEQLKAAWTDEIEGQAIDMADPAEAGKRAIQEAAFQRGFLAGKKRTRWE